MFAFFYDLCTLFIGEALKTIQAVIYIYYYYPIELGRPFGSETSMLENNNNTKNHGLLIYNKEGKSNSTFKDLPLCQKISWTENLTGLWPFGTYYC